MKNITSGNAGINFDAVKDMNKGDFTKLFKGTNIDVNEAWSAVQEAKKANKPEKLIAEVDTED